MFGENRPWNKLYNMISLSEMRTHWLRHVTSNTIINQAMSISAPCAGRRQREISVQRSAVTKVHFNKSTIYKKKRQALEYYNWLYVAMCMSVGSVHQSKTITSSHKVFHTAMDSEDREEKCLFSGIWGQLIHFYGCLGENNSSGCLIVKCNKAGYS